MKRLLAILLTAILLTSCAAPGPEPPPAEAPAPPSPATEATAETTTPPALPEETETEEEPELPEEDPPPAVFVPDHPLTIEETVEAYFREMYRGYLAMEPVDYTSILLLEDWDVKNSVTWNGMLAMRRRLILENGYCYVETEELPYRIEYIDGEELVDPRLALWAETRPLREGEELRHFVIRGEPGRAYPPFFAVNAQHSVRLARSEGMWKIAQHYFPSSDRKWIRGGLLVLPDEEKMRLDLSREFGPSDSGYPDDSGGGLPYDPEAAVAYALLYAESPNPDVYHAGERLGNCQNYVSQCVSAGFGGRMTAGWYMGGGGGSPAWENVGYFWDWITGSGELLGHEIAGAPELIAGDIIQTEGGGYRSMGGDPPGSYGHCLMVADEETLLLAQNTPACFVYYSDLVNVKTRMVRPVLLG